MLNEIEQLKQFLQDKRNVLIALKPNPEGDAISAALALKLFLEKHAKKVDIVSADFIIPKNLRFLPQSESIRPFLSNLQKFIIKVDVTKAPIETLSYDVKDGWLSIYLTPKTGAITKNELRTAQTAYKYNLIFTLETSDLNALGDIFANNTDLFYRLPVVNIDHNAGNEHFGQLNFVDLTAGAVSQIVYEIIKQIGETEIDETIATAILTGLIIKTNSFKTPNLTPRLLDNASQLIKLGAAREKIVQNLFRTKSISTLKLWGQALTHLQSDKLTGLISIMLTREDFVRAGAQENDINGIIDELLSSAPEAKLALITYESPETAKIKAVLAALNKESDARQLLSEFYPQGDKKEATITFTDETLKEAERKIIESVSQKLKIQ